MEEAQAGGRKYTSRESSQSSGKSRRAPLGPHIVWKPAGASAPAALAAQPRLGRRGRPGPAGHLGGRKP